MDFTNGRVTVETVAGTDPKAHLRQAIITTLLTPEDPASVDLYSDADVTLGGKPFLYQQVLDQDKNQLNGHGVPVVTQII